MFVLATVRDNLKVIPESFDRPTLDVLTEVVDMKYSNKVIINVGLAICLHSFESVGDALVYPSDGSAHYEAEFRLLMFRPFVGEVLTGKIGRCSETGITVSIGFFEDITIPKPLLCHPSVYHKRHKAWVWKYSDADADAADFNPDDSYIMQVGDEIRFRVRTLDFTEVVNTANGYQATTVSTGPQGGGGEGGGGAGGARAKGLQEAPPMGRQRSTSIDITTPAEAPPCMSITASINEDGLGLTSWW
ncbi:RNA polymerase III subunit Rpc25-domain-containing protein [Tribonema minus]|uniref:RNA polymerase III subunit Rpc25-domain-containing protein n=1 Tax=Tribonema minus TaxID=303371 RepID=A0A835YK61_9STRA|nr:RNA polymerase III subunit Rpc25-domain-containing protein [Tribonema minus]